MLKINTPRSFPNERKYIFDVIFKNWLGLDYEHIKDDVNEITISMDFHSKTISMPDTFFDIGKTFWLDKKSLPIYPLQIFDLNYLGHLPSSHLESTMPIIYGNINFLSTGDLAALKVPIDIFGSSFFMLTRYEEIIQTTRDEHSRFSATSSIAFKFDFLNRPIIDEYLELLKAILIKLYPNIKIKKGIQNKIISCDVDSLHSFNNSITKISRALIGDFIKRKSIDLALRNFSNSAKNFLSANNNKHLKGLNWILDSNEKMGNQVQFYFMAGKSHSQLDGSYRISEKLATTKLREISIRGHEIGLHPSYNSYANAGVIKGEIKSLKRVLDINNIIQENIGARQHFLRWDIMQTPHHYESAGISHDATLGFADIAGFRCGTSREYSLFNFNEKSAFKCKIRPLVFMECSIIADRYMGMGYSDESINLMLLLKKQSLRFGGNFSMLWHNCHFNTPKDFEFYSQLIT